MNKILGILLILASIVIGIWLGIFVMFIGGIIEIIQSFQANPINAYGVGWGLIKFLCSGFVGWLSFGILFGFGAALLDS